MSSGMGHFFRWVVLGISKDCNALCLQGQGVPSLVRLLDPKDRRHYLPSDVPFTSQKNWLFSNITERTSDLWFPFVHCLLQAVITVCVPCSWWCIKQNDGNKLQDARPLIDQAYLNIQAVIFMLLFPEGCLDCPPVSASQKVDVLREARLHFICWPSVATSGWQVCCVLC